MRQIIYWGLLSFLCISCGNKDKPLLAYISLDQTEIIFEHSGGTSIVKLTTDGEWQASNIPDWISLDQSSGKISTEIKITVEANENTEPREAEILFVRDDQNVTLNVNQTKKEKELMWSSLCFSSFDNVNFVFGKNNIERIYSFSTRQLFINPDATLNLKEKVFLGNLVNRNLEKNTEIEVYKGYTFNSITAFPSTGTEYAQTFIPSRPAQEAFASQILSGKPAQSEKFLTDESGVVYNSHRELNLIGIGNMGVKLDEVIFNKSYQDQEMALNNGIIYSFTQTLFTLNMDMQEHIVKEEISKNDFPDNSISYILSVSYGRIGLLIIESDHNVAKIRSAVNKIMQAKSAILTQEETAILNESNAYHLYYDESQKLKIAKGKADVIEAYKNQMTDDILNVFPFKITVSDYFEQGESNISFNLTLP